MMTRNKDVRLMKIPLRPFIEMLMDVYDMGLDYVNIVGTPNEVQDFVGVEFDDEYFCKDGEHSLEDFFMEDEYEFRKLTQQDIDLLQSI